MINGRAKKYNIDLVIIDFDETLFELKVDWLFLRRDIATEFLGLGRSPNLYPLYNSIKEELKNISMEYDSNTYSNIKKNIEDILCRYESAGVSSGSFYKGAIEFLTKLNKMGIKVSILSSNSRLIIQKALRNSNIDFCYICGWEDTDELKPSDQGVKKILKYYDISSKYTLGFGNSHYDLKAYRLSKLKKIFLYNRSINILEQNNTFITDYNEIIKWIERN